MFHCRNCQALFSTAVSLSGLPVCPWCSGQMTGGGQVDDDPMSRTLRKLGDRDRWTCHLCHLPSTRAFATAAWHRRAITFVPVSKGGGDGMGNLKLAHDICNRKRGDALLTEEPRCH